MDLYRVLRVSIYLTVASGAFALSVAEHNLTYLFAVLGFGGLAYITVDSGRVKPVRMEYAGAMTLALVLYTLIPLYEDDGFTKHLSIATAHFLCAFQVLLFFTTYRGSVLLTFCGSTLLVVVVSGVIQPDVSLLVRMTCYVGLTAWTLFVHALWRSRENYNRSGSVVLGVAPSNESGRTLSERAFWQGLNLTLGLSVACIVLGASFFFLAPRVNESVMAFLDNFLDKRSAVPASSPDDKAPGSNSGIGSSHDPGPGLQVKKGWDESGDYRVSGPISDDHRVSYLVYIPGAVADIADRKGRVYLRGMVMSRHDAKLGRWLPEDHALQALSASGGKLEVADPSTRAPVDTRKVVRYTVNQRLPVAHTFFSAGPIASIEARDVKGAKQNIDGTLWKGDPNIERYTVTSYAPLFGERLGDEAFAEHHDYKRYIEACGLIPSETEALRKLAHSIVQKANAETSMQKIRAILAYLRNPDAFEYSLKGDGFSVYDFLMKEGSHRGQCSYFATAFVLLCRLNQIPARYATGFCASLPDEQRKAKDQTIEFRNSDSHAWAEVHFKDLGWAIFDATPEGSGDGPSIASHPGPNKAGETNLDEPASAAAMQPPTKPEEGLLTKTWNAVLQYNSRDQRNVYDRISSVVIGGTRDVFTGRTVGGWFIAIVAWVAVGAMLYVLLGIFLRRGKRRNVTLNTGTGRARAAVAFYNDLLQVLSRRGFVRKPGQTPREFAEHVVRRGGDSFKPVLVVTGVFEQVRYGGVDVSQDDFNALQSALDSLRELTFAAATPAPRN